MNKTQRANLQKLANALRNGFPKNHEFDMHVYCASITASYPPIHAECGSIHCAIGTGPLIGIKAKKDEEWNDYSKRVFGIYPYCNNNIYGWLFTGLWANSDNTKDGAADRIEYFLKHGQPPAKFDGYNYDRFCYGWENK